MFVVPDRLLLQWRDDIYKLCPVWPWRLTARCAASTLSPHRPGLTSVVRFHAVSRQTMAANSYRRRSANGRTRMAWKSTFRALASRPTTRETNPSLDASGRNASTRIGSCRWRTPDAKSRPGGSSVTRRTLRLSSSYAMKTQRDGRLLVNQSSLLLNSFRTVEQVSQIGNGGLTLRCRGCARGVPAIFLNRRLITGPTTLTAPIYGSLGLTESHFIGSFVVTCRRERNSG